jgi:DNA adenine methylase
MIFPATTFLDNSILSRALPVQNNMNIFLNSLRSSQSSNNKYKRYNGSPLRYAGGKSLAVGTICELIPKYTHRIISPFFGGGSVEIACAIGAGIKVLGFDIFDLLVNYWQVQISNPVALANRLSKFRSTNEEFYKVKERLKKHWEGTELIEDKIDLAAYYYFNHNTSYGPGFLSWPSSVYIDSQRYERMIEKVRTTILSNMHVECNSFEKVFSMYKHEFFYCDPPYFLEGDSKMFRGIYPQRNFPIHHKNFNHILLRDLLFAHKGQFILSYNDCSAIREWYKDALDFAIAIGLPHDYQNDPIAKKDVIDGNGDAHSVKSGTKRWQVFLYGRNRFAGDDAFQSMNGIGQLLIKCLDVYPKTYQEYVNNKAFYKDKLRTPMRELKELFMEKRRVRTFISKSYFNGGEVDYLTVKYEDKFHVFYHTDVVDVLGENMEISNSKALKANDTPEQKVLFKYNGVNLGELEIRNSGEREVLFVWYKIRIINLLLDKIQKSEAYNTQVILYGKAISKFKVKK